MGSQKNEIWDLVVYDHTRGKTQYDYENDYNDPIHWYNGKTYESKLAVGEIRRDRPCDVSAIFDYIIKLSNDEIKNQDHYLILGLDHIRYRATESQIKLAYRKACLLFHPDRHHSKYELPHSQFVHITKAYEVLSDPEKRQSYDSIDSEVDDSIPNSSDEGDFYELFGRAFYRNARWSVEQPVPLVGNEKTSYQHAHKFYTFWKNFRSKREFSHLDEQPVESGDCREERRYLARLNKKQREEHKKNENKRIRQLIDNCRACDPRIPRYMKTKAEIVRLEKEEKKKKQQLKKAARNNFSADSLEKVSPIKEQTSSPAPPPAADSQKINQEKQVKKQLKRQLDENKKKLRELVEKHNYFVKTVVKGDEKLNSIGQFDNFIRIIKLSDIEELNSQLEKLDLDFDACANVYKKKFNSYYKNCEIDNGSIISSVPSPVTTTQTSSNKSVQSSTTSQNTWTKERIVLLLKAMKIYPAGTRSRYEIVTEYINNHTGCNFDVKQIIQQAKTLTVNQDTNVVKMEADKKIQQIRAAQPEAVPKKSEPEQQRNASSSQHSSICEWSVEEQKLFQQALKNIPIGTNDRWIKISTLIPTKTPLQCQQRLKYLCDVIKKKKEKH